MIAPKRTIVGRNINGCNKNRLFSKDRRRLWREPRRSYRTTLREVRDYLDDSEYDRL